MGRTVRLIRGNFGSMVLDTAFTGAGIAHVIKHEWFEQLVLEPFTQWRKPISAVTAVIQFVGGISMFIPRLRAVVRWANLAMLVPTLPAAAAQIEHPEVLRKAVVPPAPAPVRVVVPTLVAALTRWPPDPQPTTSTSQASAHPNSSKEGLITVREWFQRYWSTVGLGAAVVLLVLLPGVPLSLSETKCLRNLGLFSGSQARHGHGVAAVCPRFPEHPIDGRV